MPKARCLLGLMFVVSQYFGSWFSRDKEMLTSVPRYLRHMSRGISGNLFDNGCLASEARQAEGEALVGKYGWEALGMWASWAFCKLVHISMPTPYLSIKMVRTRRSFIQHIAGRQATSLSSQNRIRVQWKLKIDSNLCDFFTICACPSLE